MSSVMSSSLDEMSGVEGAGGEFKAGTDAAEVNVARETMERNGASTVGLGDSRLKSIFRLNHFKALMASGYDEGNRSTMELRLL